MIFFIADLKYIHAVLTNNFGNFYLTYCKLPIRLPSELTFPKRGCGSSRNIQQVGNLSLYMDVHVHQYLPQRFNP